QRTFIAIQPERIGSQGRPVRAERSEPRSGARDGRGAEATNDGWPCVVGPYSWREERRATTRFGRDSLSFWRGYHERCAVACSAPGWMAIDAARFASKQESTRPERAPAAPAFLFAYRA